MALGKRLINTGAVAACTTDSTDPFGDSSGVALYSLDYDASTAPDGTDYSGTPTNVEFGVGGKINYGARFNGSSSKIESNVLQSTNMTFSCWFKTTTTGEREYLMGFNTSGSAGYISTRLNANDTIGIAYWNGSTYAAVSSSAITRDTNYNHICITISGTSYTIYYNGSSIGSGTLSGFSASSRTDFVMGFDAPTGATGYMNGSLDQVRIFSKALSSDEVDSLFAETACVYTATTTDNYYPLADGSSDAVAYYKLDNSSEDYVGSNDGTDTNIEYRFGRFGQAAVFNGSSSVIDINSLATVLDAQNIVSVSFWFKSSATALSGLFSYRGSASSAVNMLVALNRSATGDIGLDSSTSGAFVNLGTYNGTYNDGNWHHVVSVINYTTGAFNVYIDNTLRITGTNASISRGTADKVQLGTNYGSQILNGLIDQVRIYSTALTSSQVTELYNEKPCADTSNFKTVLYEGNGGTQYISNVGMDLETDGGLVWIKNRDSAYNHYLYDSIRGAKNILASDSTIANAVQTNGLSSFEANGFFLEGNRLNVNENNSDIVAWVWKGGGDAVNIGVNSITASTPSIASDVSANTGAGFSIVKWSSNGTVGATVGHGLDYPPEMIILKDTSNARNWLVYHSGIGATSGIQLNLTVAAAADSQYWNNTSPTSSVFSVSTYSNESGSNNMIAYCFHSVAGYSKIGSYEGLGTSTVTVSGLGFKPSWIIVKNADDTANWNIYDSRRSGNDSGWGSMDTMNDILYPNLNIAEVEGGSTHVFTANSDGFVVGASNHLQNNKAGDTFIYMAFK